MREKKEKVTKRSEAWLALAGEGGINKKPIACAGKKTGKKLPWNVKGRREGTGSKSERWKNPSKQARVRSTTPQKKSPGTD